MFWGIIITLLIMKGVSQRRRDAPADPSLCDTSLGGMKLVDLSSGSSSSA